MEIKLKLNGRNIMASVEADTVLLDFLREKGCLSVKRGCDTSNCAIRIFISSSGVLGCCCAVRFHGDPLNRLRLVLHTYLSRYTPVGN